jgi:EAL domain-containing protein (putative c-di-GMP-specific phosphodiesterase class I)
MRTVCIQYAPPMSPFDIGRSGLTESITRPIPAPRGLPAGSPETLKRLSAGERTELFNRALESLWLAFQPIVSVKRPDDPPFAFEALARNAEPDTADPRNLLRLAVSVGGVMDLAQVVHRRAADVLRRNPTLTLFVNVDVEELMGPLGDDEDPLTEFASRVVLEVTERSPISDLPELREHSARLRQKGFRFAIDDLGGGYAGLSSLALMDPEFVKIDQALIHGLDVEPVKQKIVGSLVSLTRQLGIGCIVEGVETPSERDTLIGLECDLMQGFLFGRPAVF